MTDTEVNHFFGHFFANVRAQGEQPLLYEKQGALFQKVTQQETISRVVDFARGLTAAAIGAGERVALHAAASPILLIAEWAILASRGVAVIVPRGFTPQELTDTLLESKSRLVIVDRLATAYQLADAAAALPDLRHILCVEGGAQARIPIWSWGDFIDSGRREADRTIAMVRSITDKDTALMFYYKDASNARLAIRYTHGLMMDHISRIEQLLKSSALRSGEILLTAMAWENPLGHIASCYAPVLKCAVIEITHGVPDLGLFESGPQVVVGDAAFFEGLRQSIVAAIRHSGQVESWMLKKSVSLSKMRFESSKNYGLFAGAQKALLQATIVNKIQKMLGGRLRLFIGTDDEAPYETQLFFHTFGIELVELPQEAFR